MSTVVIAGLGFGIWRYCAGDGKPSFRYETAKVEKGRIAAKVTATGTLSALVTVQVGSQVSGRIQQLFVDFNSPVKKGQLIAKIDPQLFEAAVEQAQANSVAAQGNLSKAQAQAIDAERQYRRARALGERQLIAQADVDTAQTNSDAAVATVEAAKGNVAQAKANLHQAQINLAYTNIISPTNGVVISRSVDVGQTVAASLQAPTLFMIAEDLAKMQVDTSVAEADVGKLKAQMAATFTVDAYPSERFTGTVRQIRNAPQTVQNVVTYDAVIDVDNAELKLKPGMTANVTFIYAEREDVVRVPNAALRFRPPPQLLARVQRDHGATVGERRRRDAALPPNGSTTPPADTARQSREPESPDHRTVWILRGELPEMIPLKIGISDGSVSEVVEGSLQAGDRVVIDASSGTDTNRSGPGGGSFGFRRLF
ncbi:MAG: efflux RND transporter periplasmic adaptor subunit [Deltaproteobacteria bacterium]|nr:efflux RND transporter periplasmic adaptor subunit [Deltaproteobacteria bacterium]